MSDSTNHQLVFGEIFDHDLELGFVFKGTKVPLENLNEYISAERDLLEFLREFPAVSESQLDSYGFFHWVECRVRDNTVYVFGICNDVAYVEGFDAASGDAQFRFSTSYVRDITPRVRERRE